MNRLAKRSKKRRIKIKDKVQNPYKLIRVGGFVKYGKCQQIGHNARGFKAGITGETSWKRRMTRKNAKSNTTTETRAAKRKVSSNQAQVNEIVIIIHLF